MRHNASRARLTAALSGRDPIKREQIDALLKTATSKILALLDAAEAEVRREKEHCQFWRQLGGACLTCGLFPIVNYISSGKWDWGHLAFTTLLGFAGGYLCIRISLSFDRTRLRHMALQLAARNNPFAADYLIEAWQPHDKDLRVIPDEKVEQGLLSLMSQRLPGEPLSPRSRTPETLRNQVGWCFPVKSILVDIFNPKCRTIAPRGEFSDTRAALLITLLRHLAASPDTKDRKVVEWVAQSQVRTLNQTLVRDAAQMFLQAGESTAHDSALPPVAITTVVPAATPASAVRVGQETKP